MCLLGPKYTRVHYGYGRKDLPMKRICLSMLIAVMCMSCRSNTVYIPPGTTIEYQNDEIGIRVKVTGHLAQTILATLAEAPDVAVKGGPEGAASSRKLYIGDRVFLMIGGELTLIDTWGTRAWFVSNMDVRLDAFLRREVEQGRGVPAPGGAWH